VGSAASRGGEGGGGSIGPLAAQSGALSDAQTGGVRVLSYNVLRSSPKQKPEVYARILKAIDADVLLLQEWESSGPADLQQWFGANASTLGNWQARTVAGEVGQGGGVDEPLVGQPWFDHHAGAVAIGDHMDVGVDLVEQTQALHLRLHELAGFVTV
jgi:hypothetical protein